MWVLENANHPHPDSYFYPSHLRNIELETFLRNWIKFSFVLRHKILLLGCLDVFMLISSQTMFPSILH
jgi:hypothetical protein